MGLYSTLRYITGHPLNRHRKLQAIRQFITWQIGSRLVPGPVAVPFINNACLLVSPGMTAATGNVYCGLHEFEEMALLLHFLKVGDLFVDVGANIGSYTILASAVIGAESIAVEPIPATFEYLMRNISINGVNSLVSAMNMGLAATPGQMTFINGLDTVNHVATEYEKQAAETISVQVEMLDNICGKRIPQLVKIDVEGFETAVIGGANHVLADNQLGCLIMELNGSGKRYGFDEDALHRRILDFGFSSFLYKPFDRKLEDLNGQKSITDNTVYIRDIDFVRARIALASAVKVHGLQI